MKKDMFIVGFIFIILISLTYVRSECVSDWNCVWGSCNTGEQYASCIDNNNCNDTSTIPPTIRSCNLDEMCDANSGQFCNDTNVNKNNPYSISGEDSSNGKSSSGGSGSSGNSPDSINLNQSGNNSKMNSGNPDKKNNINQSDNSAIARFFDSIINNNESSNNNFLIYLVLVFIVIIIVLVIILIIFYSIGSSKIKVKINKMNDSKKKVEDLRLKGISEDKIRQSLIQENWSLDDITEILRP